MAGIGFELKKLFNEKGILARIRAYGYAGAVTTGPLLLGEILILSISWMGLAMGLAYHARELLMSMITYALIFSLLFTSPVSMVTTRYISDMIYIRRDERILPSLFGCTALMLPLAGIVYGIFLVNAGIAMAHVVLCFTLFEELIVVWLEINYLTAIKDYKGVAVSYLASIVTAVAVGVLGAYFAGASVTLFLSALVAGYGVMLCLNLRLLLRFFPSSRRHHFEFLKWFDTYKWLFVIGLMTDVGVFAHIIVAWTHPALSRNIQGLFYMAPAYDVPALYAFLTCLVTTINFVVSVEVNFYPTYRRLFDLYNGDGTIAEIDDATRAMVTTLDRELGYTAQFQLFVTAFMISLGGYFLGLLPLGFNGMMGGFFRTLCLSYGIYAVANVLMMILMYFDDYTGAGMMAIAFAAVTTVGSILQRHVAVQYYGFAFTVGAIIYFVFGLIRLYRYLKHLDYHILSEQPIYVREKRGFFTRLSDRLTKSETHTVAQDARR